MALSLLALVASVVVAVGHPTMMAAVETRPAKMARLSRLRGTLPQMSQTALAALLAAAKEAPLPDVSRRDDVREAKQLAARTLTPYGPVHAQLPMLCHSGAVKLVEVQSPWPMLHLACQTSEGFSSFISDLCGNVGAPTIQSPWGLIMYSDEVDPGDPLMGKHGRKYQAVYWSILEFGANALSEEELWFTFCTVRSVVVRQMVGGMSALMACLLRHMFHGVHSPSDAGILIDLGGLQIRFFFELRQMIGDELALQQLNCHRGASAEVPCMFCMNVKSKRSIDVLHDRAGYFVLVTCVDCEKFKFHSDVTIRKIAFDLRDRSSVETKEGMKTLQKQLGYSYIPNSLLLCPVLKYKPATLTVYDWMHCFLVDGVFNITVGQTMAVAHKLGVSYKNMASFVATWSWPRRLTQKGAIGKDLFKPSRIATWRKEQKFKCSASEALSLYPVMAAFLQMESTRLGLAENPAFAVLYLCCDVLDHLLCIPRGTCTPEGLAEAIVSFLRLYKLVFGEKHWTPKFHSILHLPRMLAEHKVIIPCFVAERKHKEGKRIAGYLHNTSVDFERSLLEDITTNHLHALRDFVVKPRICSGIARCSETLLAQLQASFPDAISLQVGKRAKFNQFNETEVGDIVLAQIGNHVVAAEICGAIVADGAVFFLVSKLKLISSEKRLSKWQRVGQELRLLEGVSILGPCVHRNDGDVVVVIRCV